MTNPVVGRVVCPHCGNDATVHQEKRGKRCLYYRCYAGPNGDCGTVQIRYEGGQAWIKKHMRALDETEQDKAAEEAAGAAAVETVESVREVRREKAKAKANSHKNNPKGSGVLETMLKGADALFGEGGE